MTTEAEVLREAALYASKKPRRVAPGDCLNYPALEKLYRYAVFVHSNRPKAKQFAIDGVRYEIVWQGQRMCVMHVRSKRILVGEPGERK
jgi:hypothetical protein